MARHSHFTLSPLCPLDDRQSIVHLMGPGPWRLVRREVVDGVPNLVLRCLEASPEFTVAERHFAPCARMQLARGARSFEHAKAQAHQACKSGPPAEGLGMWVGRVMEGKGEFEWGYRWCEVDSIEHVWREDNFEPVYLIEESLLRVAA